MALDPELKGKVALVTGGSTGIGRAISVALAREGVDICIASRTRRDDALSEIEATGSHAKFLRVDLTNEAEVDALVERCVNECGSLDMLVCNAAQALHEPALDISTSAWIATLSTNLLSCVWLCRSAAQFMVKNGGGSILIVGSTAQFHRAVGQTSYHVSKSALATFSSALATDLAVFGIRVNLLVPGRFETAINTSFPKDDPGRDIPLGRSGEPSECGPAAVLLLSDRLSSYITGAELVVSGGSHLRPMGLSSRVEPGRPVRFT